MPAPAVKLPPLGKVALVPSAYPLPVLVHGRSKPGVRSDATAGLDSMMVRMTDDTQNEAAMYGAVLASPVIAGGLVRAATLGALTGLSKAEIREAEAFAFQPKNQHRLAGPIAADLRSSQGLPNLPPEDAPKRAVAVAAGAESTVEIDVLSLRLEQLAGGWGLRGVTLVRVIRTADDRLQHSTSAEYLTPAKRAPAARLDRTRFHLVGRGMWTGCIGHGRGLEPTIRGCAATAVTLRAQLPPPSGVCPRVQPWTSHPIPARSAQRTSSGWW